MDTCAIGTDVVDLAGFGRQIGANQKIISLFQFWPPGGGFAV
jgi:hypothetical protein